MGLSSDLVTQYHKHHSLYFLPALQPDLWPAFPPATPPYAAAIRLLKTQIKPGNSVQADRASRSGRNF